MTTTIKISRDRGTVYADLESDIDHLARYTMVLWQQNDAGKWEQLPSDRVVPPSSNTLDKGYHQLLADPAQMGNMALQVFVAVSSIVTNPRNLDLNLLVWQGPRNLKFKLRSAPEGGTYPVDYHEPVPPGEEVSFDVAWQFELA